MEKTTPHLELITRYFSDFTSLQWQQLGLLQDLYHSWNQKINVISRKDIDDLYRNHVLHSLAIAAAFQFEKNMEVLDIGTGGGFPAIPLAIFFPDARFHGVDSIGKKIKVVAAVAEAIGLKNLTVQHTRAEALAPRKFDCVVSRAVAPLGMLWSWSKPLIRKTKQLAPTDPPDHRLPVPNGLICFKGGDLAAEISESGTRPRVLDVHALFPEEYFRQKYLLYIPR